MWIGLIMQGYQSMRKFIYILKKMTQLLTLIELGSIEVSFCRRRKLSG